jgi:hypothetical protein
MKKLLKAILPHGLVLRLQARGRERKRRRFAPVVVTENAAEIAFSREGAIEFLTARGIDPDQLDQGSMPDTSLALISTILIRELKVGDLLGLHVGNFVGVSLGQVVATARTLDPNSLVLAIDPNLPHRGVFHPQEHVSALLAKFSLTRNALIVTAYSLEKSASNDGENYDGSYDPSKHFGTEHACENALEHLKRRLPGRFYFILIDGNHDDDYLARELGICRDLLRDGGLLILDDVSEGWAGVSKRFHELADDFEILVEDGRIGIASKASPTQIRED